MIRFGGLESGMDTQSIVDAMLNAESVRKVRLENEIYQNQDKLAAWTELDASVTMLSSAALSLTNFSTWNQMRAESTDADVVTATADNTAVTADYSVEVTQLATKHRIASDAQVDSTTALGLTGDFNLGGELITVSATDSLTAIRDSINTAADNMDADEAVFASLIGDTLVIERVQTGDVDIDISENSGGVLKSLGIFDGSDNVNNELQTSEDLSVNVNGVTVTRDSNTGHTDIVEGVTLSFHKEQADAETVSVGHDTATIKSLLVDFVDKYNATMELANAQTAVVLGTEGELSGLGILQGESAASSLGTRARGVMTAVETDPNKLDQSFNSLQAIGIWTEGRDNQLAIVDESRLDDALANNFAEVEDLLRDFDAGVMKNMDRYLDSLISPIDGSVVNRRRAVQADIDSAFDEIDEINVYLDELEVSLWERFSRMETTMAGISGQGNMVLSALGAKTT